jgi:hypothetical protein
MLFSPQKADNEVFPLGWERISKWNDRSLGLEWPFWDK